MKRHIIARRPKITFHIHKNISSHIPHNSFDFPRTMNSKVESPGWVFNYFKFLGLYRFNKSKAFTIRYQALMICSVLVNFCFGIYLELSVTDVEFTTQMVDVYESINFNLFT